MMSDRPEPLWSDQRIATLAQYAAVNWDAEHIGDLLLRLRDDYEAELAELRAAATAALGWIDEIYPPDIFDRLRFAEHGSSGDEGPVLMLRPPLRSDDDEASAGEHQKVRIVAIRENLRRALQEQRPGGAKTEEQQP